MEYIQQNHINSDTALKKVQGHTKFKRQFFYKQWFQIIHEMAVVCSQKS